MVSERPEVPPARQGILSLGINYCIDLFIGEDFMEDFPIWLKLAVWGLVGLTVLYTAWGIVSSIMAS